MIGSLWLWVAFNLFVLALLALDLGVFHRRAHVPTIREALAWTAGWVVLALGFNAAVWRFAGEEKALEFFTGYLLEKSLSVDNLFVFTLVFSYFAVAPQYQHKVLFWGILGALLLRGTLIGLGTALIHHFTWILYLFGAFLILSGLRLAFKKDIAVQPDKNPVVRAFRTLVPLNQAYDGQRFFRREAGRLCATPLLVVLVCMEVTDLMFATDSIPAVFAVTQDPFIVYTSNVFAMLGLRALYFALAGLLDSFRFLKFGLSLILAFVGAKLFLAHTAWQIRTLPALVVVATILAASVLVSVMYSRRGEEKRLRSGSSPANANNRKPPASSPLLFSPSVQTDGAKPPAFSQELRQLAATFADRPARFADVLEATQGRGFNLLLILVTLPFLTPIPLPGLSAPFGLIAIFIGARSVLGRKPWLPKRLLARQLPPRFLAKTLNASSHLMRGLEFLLKPRLAFLHEALMFRRLAGALILLSGLLMLLPLPLPFSNSLPALTILLLAAGALERDGIFFLAGCSVFLVTAAYFLMLALGGAHLVDDVLHKLTGH